MVSPAAGSIVLVTFPFSDLSAAKLRPAIVLASAERDDWILCQLTSNPYSDPNAVQIGETDFASGSLQRTSFARPGKLFTANTSLMKSEVGRLTPVAFQNVLTSVIGILHG
ncbi:MAG: MazF family transcriptional regulator [Lentisphaerales bacterium]|jgi:mRNA interferase MazF|nr:MAG: MazF family transcriptional regulator [Lentisphaerales bacterium]